MSEKVTAQQVARRAGVSQSAVSRVFTPGASVSEKMATRVREAAEELGYRPNILARAMVSGRSRIVGFVVAYLDNYFYPEAIEKLSNAMQKRGYHLLMFMASQTTGSIDDVVDEILDYQIDGLIFASVALSSSIVRRCQAAGVPVVLFNRRQDMEGISSITSDNFAGGRKIGEYLIACGHKRIGYIAGWEGASTQRDREAGLMAALKTHSMDLFAREVGNFRKEGAIEAALSMFDKPSEQAPDAVFVANDHMAFHVLDVLRHRFHMRVPEDVAVVGYDDVPPAAWPAYDLTTVRQRANLMVEETVNTLIQHVENPKNFIPRQVAIDGPLIERGTSRRQPLPKA
ncbi:MAG TPA: LacI family transcriptional regulator [Alphaproteobacteria bacterium]|nr:LacI family transcriptional regulator [Alphaproteobacteria bacterium]